VTLLSASPSYLGELVVAARREDSDQTISAFDASMSAAKSSRRASPRPPARRLARSRSTTSSDDRGPAVTARTCSHGHLHHDVTTGHVEHLDLETGELATPGSLATVVITPYFPYRDCMPVFRYDTRDVVRQSPTRI